MTKHKERRVRFKCFNPECPEVLEQPVDWFKDRISYSCPLCLKQIAIDFDLLPQHVKDLVEQIREEQKRN